MTASVLICSSNFGKKMAFNHEYTYVYRDTVKWNSDMGAYEVNMCGQEKACSEKLIDNFIREEICHGAFINSSDEDIDAGGGVKMEKGFIGTLINASLVKRRGDADHNGPSVYTLCVKRISPAEYDLSMLPDKGITCWKKKTSVVRVLGVPCSNLSGAFMHGIFVVHVAGDGAWQKIASRLNKD
jgi:hypothetical protein